MFTRIVSKWNQIDKNSKTNKSPALVISGLSFGWSQSSTSCGNLRSYIHTSAESVKCWTSMAFKLTQLEKIYCAESHIVHASCMHKFNDIMISVFSLNFITCQIIERCGGHDEPSPTAEKYFSIYTMILRRYIRPNEVCRYQKYGPKLTRYRQSNIDERYWHTTGGFVSRISIVYCWAVDTILQYMSDIKHNILALQWLFSLNN